MRWVVIFSGVCASVFALAYSLMWGAGVFSDLGLRGTVAAVLATFLTTLIGVGLMALTFYSNRSGHDSTVHRLDEDRSSSTGAKRK
jgi:hypothetical protein